MRQSMLALALASISGVLVCLPVSAVFAKPLSVEVVNAEPISVVSPPPPLWQGTPYISKIVIFGPGCAEFEAVPAGMVLFVQRANASFNVKPGENASAWIQFEALRVVPQPGGNILDIPTYPSGPVKQPFGVYDGYSGVVDVGLPTAVTPEACYGALGAADVRGRITITGYLVPASP